jgi:alkanesulfonate monooxygenase SsuD/methylene tetrahydromethanopterin reductase-like flavin-dependent oxidoreductase (luciferase family)
MRVGIVILPQLRWAEQAGLWRRAEAYGFDHAWTYDHLTWDPLAGQPWGATMPTLVAAATVTARIRLGTWVASPNYRHPVTFARELAALDDVSGGRAVAGIGAGGTGSDATVLGDPVLPSADRAERLAEFLTLLDLVLTRPSTTWRGRFYAAVEARTTQPCVQQPRLPVVVAANGSVTMSLAAQFGRGWATHGHPGYGVDDDAAWWRGVRELAERFDAVLAESGRDAGSVDRMLSVDGGPTFSLVSAGHFAEVVGGAAELGFTDVVAHWPVPGAPVYDAPETMVERIAELLPGLR